MTTGTVFVCNVLHNFSVQVILCQKHSFLHQLTQGCQFSGNFHSSGIQGIRKWQFSIPRGSGNLKAIPRVLQGISGNMKSPIAALLPIVLFLQLHHFELGSKKSELSYLFSKKTAHTIYSRNNMGQKCNCDL